MEYADGIIWDEQGFAQQPGYIVAALINEKTGIWLGNERIFVQAGTKPAKCYIFKLPPERELPFSYGWKWNNGKWEETQMPASWEVPRAYNVSRTPPLPQKFSAVMWRERQTLWMKISALIVSDRIKSERKIPNSLMLSVQGLMHSENNLLKIEDYHSENYVKLYENNEFSVNDSITLTNYYNNAGKWVSSLYEIVRSLRNVYHINIPEYTEEKFECLFDELEIIRMPLDKHSPRRKPNYNHYPCPMRNVHNHQLGWHVKDFLKEKLPTDAPDGSYRVVAIFRRELADNFLEIFASML